MIRDPRRHFVFVRSEEIASLSRVPSHNRPRVCLDLVRDASGAAVHAVKFGPKFEKVRKRLGDWRLTLAKVVERGEYADTVVILKRGQVGRREIA